MRKCVKDLEREGDADSDEDAWYVAAMKKGLSTAYQPMSANARAHSYARTNKDRSYYERLERGEARAWVTSRRATQAAQKALRDPERVRIEEALQVRAAFIPPPTLVSLRPPTPPRDCLCCRGSRTTVTSSAAAARALGRTTRGGCARMQPPQPRPQLSQPGARGKRLPRP